MQTLKSKVKQIIPKRHLKKIANYYHFGEAVAANLRYGFPARSMKVIMITGTNGKTTTAAYLASILKETGYKVGVSSTAFYQIGDTVIPNEENMTTDNVFKVQALIQKIKKAKCDYLIMETTSHALEQHRVLGIPCEVAVMTNLTQDHLDYHGTIENYAAAKAKLFAREPRYIVLNRDDKWFDYFNEFNAGEQKMNYGTHEEAESRITKAKLKKTGTDFVIEFDHTTDVAASTKLAGKFNVYNATAAATAAYLMNIPVSKIAKGISLLEGVSGRLEYVKEGQSFEVVVDYAHSPDALQNVLESLKSLTKNRLILVFGACGDRDRGKRPMMGEIASKLADRIVLTDEENYTEDAAQIRKEIFKGIKKANGEAKTNEIPDRRDAIQKAIDIARSGDIIAITGMGHEKFRIIDGKKIPWNDAEEASKIVQNKIRSSMKK